MTSAETGAGEHPAVTLLKGHSKRLRQGHPWVYSNEIEMTEAAKRLAPGTLVSLVDAGAEPLGVASFNPHSLIAARLFSADPRAAVDGAFLQARLARALALRDALYDAPHYRLVHAEADGLPGLIVDRFADVCVAQLNTAGMDRLAGEVVSALQAVLAPRAVVLRRDGAVRVLEGLERLPPEIVGALDGPVETEEAGVRFLVEPGTGQKTGWYFDQRDNRDFAARLAHGRGVLDAYCHTGAFALRVAAAGATRVIGLDSSEPALELARRNAALNRLDDRVSFETADAFVSLAARASAGDH